MSLTPHPLFRQLIAYCEEAVADPQGDASIGAPYAPSDGKWVALGLLAVAQSLDSVAMAITGTFTQSDTLRSAETIKEGLIEVAEMIKRVG